MDIELHNMALNVTKLLQSGQQCLFYWDFYVAECSTKGLLRKNDSTGWELRPTQDKLLFKLLPQLLSSETG